MPQGLTLSPGALRALVAAALHEDDAFHDVTSELCLPRGARGRAVVRAGAAGVLSGAAAARGCFRARDAALRVRVLRKEGARLRRGDAVLRVEGRAAGILAAERPALNFLMHLSGVATLASRYVRALRGTGVQLRDTRKTTPLFRALEKQAVRAGGGVNHRSTLSEAVLIKDNHVRAAGGLAAAVARVRGAGRRVRGLVVECEAQSLPEVREARDLALDWILLDNFTPGRLRAALEILRGRSVPRRPRVEVSGGITLETIRRHALPGVDAISVGALTHSAPALPFSLDWSA